MNFETGDCFRACVASILDLSIESIPNFMKEGPDKFLYNLDNWSKNIGYLLLDVEMEDISRFKDSYLIATGLSPRGKDKNHLHAVIYLNEEMVHDPHPDNTCIVEIKYYTVFVRIHNE